MGGPRLRAGAITALVLAALWAPSVVMAVFSFNESRFLARWTGFTTRWYAELWGNHEIHDALRNTIVIALVSTALSTVLGTLAALAARRAFAGKRVYATLLALPLMVPDVVLAVALLAFFRSLDVGGSVWTAAFAHTTFNLAYVAIVVSARLQGLDPDLELAAADLGATPAQAFRLVTLPAILPAIASGALLAFTLSFDDFVLTYFTAGPNNPTLPVKVFSMIRVGVNPQINAVSTLVLAASILLVLAAVRVGGRDLRMGDTR